ncbi:MAG: alpha/beta hydrolase [Clostridia bacterium]|nr:alpha/beta hydrolase [Clostridia bacterium]
MLKKIDTIYRAAVDSRKDSHGDVFYFSYRDFEGLSYTPYEFLSNEGTILRGGFYSYEGCECDELVVFDHGLGAGHTAYMKEIALIAKAGFRVFSYDHTGCMASGGDGTMGFAHSLSDLDACIRALKADENISFSALSVVGHSWGGFSTMNILKYHPDIKSIVAISGFISVRAILKDSIKGLLAPLRGRFMRFEKRTSGEYAECDAVDTLMGASANILIIHSIDDPIVSYKNNARRLTEALGGRANVRFIITEGKGHNPNYTNSALTLKREFDAELKNYRRSNHTDDENEAFIKRFDWDGITEQDKEVMDEIIKTLKMPKM